MYIGSYLKSKEDVKSAGEWRPHEMPTLIISRLAKLLSRQVDEKLAVVGLTSPQLPVLASLKGGAKMTQKELADVAGVAQPSMAQLLARMERDGLVQRVPSTTDGRTGVLSLTGEANRKLEPGRNALLQVDQEACSTLTETERELLTAILHKLVSHAQAKRSQ